MSDQEYDTIVIGAGVAGMTAAALLSRDFGRRVLVLERAPFIGGRTLSFVGKGDKVVADGIEMDARAFRKSLPLASCYLGKCTPDIETIFARGLLDGRTFEAGGHGLFWGNHSRISHVMRHLGVFVNLPLNRGLGFIDWQGEGPKGEGRPGIPHQVVKGKPYPWMSEEGYARTLEQLRDMGSATFEDMARLMKTPLQEWFEARGLHPEAYDYLKVLAASQTAQAEPAMTPAGDFLGYMAIAGEIGMNLVSGSVATCDSPGTIAMPQAMEQVCLEHGGTVLRDAPVREVSIRDGRVVGVRYGHGGQTKTARAETVVCTIPPDAIFEVLPEEHFPTDWVRLLRQDFWGAGLLTGWAGARKSFLGDIGLDPRSFVYMPGVIRDEGYVGCVDMVICEFSAWGDGEVRRGPEGAHDFMFSTALTAVEMRDPAKVGRVVDLCESWARATFPDWDEQVDFIIWTPGPDAYGQWRPVGEDRPATRSPHVEGLYFAGDQYGERLWGGGVDGAALSGVMCVDALMGSRLEETVFPPYHRGLPAGVG